MKPKDFTLRCIYQNSHINDGILTKIHHVFKRGKTGRLVFDKRPWFWYDATVLNVDDAQMTNFLNGIITITMRAYYPFGRTDITCIADMPEWEQNLRNNTAFLENYEVITNYADGEMDGTLSTPQTISLYNPGTERAHVAIELAGDVGDGIVITNRATGQSCEIVGLNTSANQKLIIDSLNGKVLLTDGDNHQYGYLYHDNGFIDLEPAYPLMRDVQLSGINGSNILTVLDEDVIFDDSYIGSLITFEGNSGSTSPTTALLGYAKLNVMILNDAHDYVAEILDVSQDGKQLTISINMPITETIEATVGIVNKIDIRKKNPDSTVNITHLNFKFLPTFS